MSSNIPFVDEYDAALKWIIQFDNSSFPDNFIALFQQQNEHRIFSYRIVVLITRNLVGVINFKYLLFFGNIGMLGILFVLFKLKPTGKHELITFVPIVLFLFVPINEITNLGIMTMNGIFQYLLAFASLLLLNKKNQHSFFLAILFAVVATFSHGNGMFIFLAGFFVLFYNPKKTKREIFIWIVIMIFFVILYFTNYNFTIGQPSKMEIFKQPITGVLFFLTFLGNFIKPFTGNYLFISQILGLVILLFYIYLLCINRYKLAEIRLENSFIVFILLSVAATVISRLGYGLEGATSPRYRLLSILFIAIVYMIFLKSYNIIPKNIGVIIIVLSVIFYLGRTFLGISSISWNKKILAQGVLSYHVNPNKTTLYYPDTGMASKLLSEAIETDNYLLPSISELYPEIKFKYKLEKSINLGSLKIQVVDFISDSSLLMIRGKVLKKSNFKSDQHIGIILKSSSNIFMFSAANFYQNGFKTALKEKYMITYSSKGFLFALDKNATMVPSGNYKVGCCIYQGNNIIESQYLDELVVF